MKRIKLNPSELRTICEPVDPAEIPGLDPVVEGMFEICDGKKCIGLAANQVGLAKRLIVINCMGFKQALFNPEIIQTRGGIHGAEEGCMSFPGQHVRVIRPRRCRVAGLDKRGQTVGFSPKNPLICRAILHEVDHLNGVTMFDRAKAPELSYDPPEGA